MALATDANISKLQQMFPKVEGDVIAILLNDNENDVEKCINNLLILSGEDASSSPLRPQNRPHDPHSHTDHTHWQETTQAKSPRRSNTVISGGGKAGEKDTRRQSSSRTRSPYANTFPNEQKKSLHGPQKKSQDSRPPMSSSQPTNHQERRQFSPGGGHGNRSRPSGPQGRGRNFGDTPHLLPQKERQTAETLGERGRGREIPNKEGGPPQGNFVPGSGASKRPALLASPFRPIAPPTGIVRLPGNAGHHPRPPPPHMVQYYPNGGKFRGPPPWVDPVLLQQQRPPYGIRTDVSGNGLRPRGVVPDGMPVARSGQPVVPQLANHYHHPPNTNRTEPPNALPRVMMTYTLPQRPSISMHGSVMPGGLGSVPHTAISNSHTPVPHTTMSNSHAPILQPYPINQQQAAQKDTKSDKNIGNGVEVGWPIDIGSDSGTEHGNVTEPVSQGSSIAGSTSGGGGSEVGERRPEEEEEEGGERKVLELAGREWQRWEDEGSEEAGTTRDKRLVILRGLPGSGKTTLARELAGKDGIVCSTDDNFYINGRYVFDRRKLAEYHEKNKKDACEAMQMEITPVVIDNTNTSGWEMKPYVELAQRLCYQVEIRETDTPWRFDTAELAARNGHGVPQEKIEKMLERYESNVTIESILASHPPDRDRAPQNSTLRGNGDYGRANGGHGRVNRENTSSRGHLTPSHPHYARKQPVSATPRSNQPKPHPQPPPPTQQQQQPAVSSTFSSFPTFDPNQATLTRHPSSSVPNLQSLASTHAAALSHPTSSTHAAALSHPTSSTHAAALSHPTSSTHAAALSHPTSHAAALSHPTSHAAALSHPTSSTHAAALSHPTSSTHAAALSHPTSHAAALSHPTSHAAALSHPTSHAAALSHPTSSMHAAALSHPTSSTHAAVLSHPTSSTHAAALSHPTSSTHAAALSHPTSHAAALSHPTSSPGGLPLSSTLNKPFTVASSSSQASSGGGFTRNTSSPSIPSSPPPRSSSSIVVRTPGHERSSSIGLPPPHPGQPAESRDGMETMLVGTRDGMGTVRQKTESPGLGSLQELKRSTDADHPGTKPVGVIGERKSSLDASTAKTSPTVMVKDNPKEIPAGNVSVSHPVSSDVNTLILPPHVLTKDEEEQRAASMSCIWGDGNWSDPVLAEGGEKKGSGGGRVWGGGGSEGVWKGEGSLPLGVQSKDGVGSNWNQQPPSSSGGSSVMWNGSVPLGGGVGPQTVTPVQKNGLVGSPLPCKFGPIGKPTKNASTPNVDSSGPPLQDLVLNGQTKAETIVGNGATIVSATTAEANDSKTNGLLPHNKTGSSREKNRPSQERIRPSLEKSGVRSPKSQSASAEVWVSEEMDNWVYESPSDAIHVQQRETSDEESSLGQSSASTTVPNPSSPGTPASTTLPNPSSPATPRKNSHHTATSTDYDSPKGVISVSPFNNYKPPGEPEVLSDSLFEDPAIVNMVKQSVPDTEQPAADGAFLAMLGCGGGGLTSFEGLRANVEAPAEPEGQVLLFTVPSPETSPANKPSSSSSGMVPYFSVPPSSSPAACSAVTEEPSAAPILLQAKDEASVEEDQGEQDVFFPSAFESDKTGFGATLMPLLQVAPIERSQEDEEIPSGGPRNNVVVTSSESDKTEQQDVVSVSAEVFPLPVNCVPNTAAVPVGSPRAKRNLWPQFAEKEEEEDMEEKNEDVSLEGMSNLTSAGVQESSLGPGSYQPYLFSSSREAGENGSSAGTQEESPRGDRETTDEATTISKEAPDAQSDIGFLEECFPDLSQHFLSLLLHKCQGNVEEAVSTALLSTVSSPAHQPVFSAGNNCDDIFGLFSDPVGAFGLPLSSLAYLHSGQVLDSGGQLDPQTNSVNSSSVTSITSESEAETGPDLNHLHDVPPEISWGEPSDLTSDVSEVEGSGLFFIPSEDDECVNDEEIARIMQEQLNMANSEQASLRTVERLTREERERRAAARQRREEEVKETECALLVPPEEDDDNLVLRLTRSLASQLQQMFGSVEDHLTLKGLLRDEDLQVLLSERAAQQIWQKWIDTLEAKKVEIQLHRDTLAKKDEDFARELQAEAGVEGEERGEEGKEGEMGRKGSEKKPNARVPLLPTPLSMLRVQSAPVVQPSPDSKPVARSVTDPGQSSNLTAVMREQSAQETSNREVCKIVMAVCNETMARKLKLRQLYGRFRILDRDTINHALLRNNFNFSTTIRELAKEVARESTDGNAPSKSGPTSFSGTTRRVVTRGGKLVKPVRPSWSPRQAKKRRARAVAGKTSVTERRDAGLRPDEIAAAKSFQELEDRPSYDDLRAEAALHAKLRSEAFQKAARARSLKQGDVAVYYAQQGHSHTEMMKEANRRAADLILQLQNDLSSHYLDLHGLHVEEALSALQERLQTTTDKVLYVITGKGIHSKGEARIRPAVMQFLRSKEYKFEEQPGRLMVQMK